MKVKKSIAQDPSAVITRQAENRQFRFETLPYFAKFYKVTAELSPEFSFCHVKHL